MSQDAAPGIGQPRPGAVSAPAHADRVMKARRPTTCPVCHLPITPGMQIAHRGVWQHIEHVIADLTSGRTPAP